MNVSMYNGSTDTVGAVVDYRKILKGISEGRWADSIKNLSSLRESSGGDRYSEAKRLLPSVTFSGTFSKRAADSLLTYTNLVVIDIDKLTEGQVKTYKEAFRQDKYVHACFVSPSGAGLKILIEVSSDHGSHLQAFLQLEKYFKENYAVDIDKSGKDVSRLCYVSYDPDLFFNADPFVFTVDASIKAPSTTNNFDKRPDKFKGHVISKDASYSYKVCKQWTERHHEYVEGNRNNYIHVLGCNLNRVGVHVDDAIIMSYNDFGDLPYQELEQAIRSAYRKTSEHNTVDVYNIDTELAKQEDNDFSVAEDTVYNDTLELFNKGVKTGMIGKLMKSFGTNHLGLSEEEVSMLMNQAAKKFKEGVVLVEHNNIENDLKFLLNRSDVMGVSTLVDEFDSILGGGLKPQQLYGFIGDGKTFKSIYAQCIASAAANSGKLVLYLNGEMSRIQLLGRIISRELGIDIYKEIKDINEERLSKLNEDLNSALKGNFEVSHGGGWTKEAILQIVSKIEGKAGKKVSLIVVDGLSQMEDTKRDEIKSAIHNSGVLKEVAKEADAAVIALVHISGGANKHFRDTSRHIRGGTKLINNMDAMFCTSLLIDEQASNADHGDIMYFKNKFYLRFIDKRGSGDIESKIMQVDKPLKLEALSIDPSTMEVNL